MEGKPQKVKPIVWAWAHRKGRGANRCIALPTRVPRFMYNIHFQSRGGVGFSSKKSMGSKTELRGRGMLRARRGYWAKRQKSNCDKGSRRDGVRGGILVEIFAFELWGTLFEPFKDFLGKCMSIYQSFFGSRGGEKRGSKISLLVNQMGGGRGA